MRLGSLQLAGRVILSPMESASDHAFRKLCYSQGAALCWTEMIRAAAVCKNNLATLELIDTFDANVPTGVQLMVRGADETLKCLHKIESFANGIDKKYIEHIGSDGTITKELRNFDHFKNIRAIDINLGCPSPEVIKGGAGPALLKRTRKLKEIFDVLVKWKETNSLGSVGAVGCKIRLGLNHVEQSNKVYMQVVELARDAGLDYICIHARHAEQRSREPPTISCIRDAVKVAGNMPVIGNGDVFTDFDAINMMQTTGCQGVMIARAAIRNPWAISSFNKAISQLSMESLGDAKLMEQFNGSTSLSKSKLEFDKKTWPTLDQVNNAEKSYIEAVTKYKTKEKFTKFNQINLERIRQVALKKDYSLEVYTPRTIHLK